MHRWTVWRCLSKFAAVTASIACAALSAAETAITANGCSIAPSSTWSAAERMVWKDVCVGRIADLRSNTENGAVLRGAFLATILGEEPYHGAIAANGVRIVGAVFEGRVDLPKIQLGGELALPSSSFRSGFSARDIQVGSIVLNGSSFSEDVALDRSQVRHTVELDVVRAHHISLAGSAVGGGIELNRSTVKALDMRGIRVTQDMRALKSHIQSANLAGAVIGGLLDMTDLVMEGQMEMRGLAVGQQVLLERASIGKLSLVGARVQGQIFMDDAVIDSEIDMDSAYVGQYLLLRRVKFDSAKFWNVSVGGQFIMTGATSRGLVDMFGINVEKSMSLDSVTFKALRMSGARIKGWLSFESATISENVSLDAMQVGETIFARRMKLEGAPARMVYMSVGGNLELSGSRLGGVDFDRHDDRTCSKTRVQGSRLSNMEGRFQAYP